jgi:hypothetical protein
LASRGVEARYQRGVGVRPPAVNLLFGPKMNRQEVVVLVSFGQPRPCSLVHD